MTAPAVIVLTLGIDELRALIGDEVSKRLAAVSAATTSEEDLVSKQDLAAKLNLHFALAQWSSGDLTSRAISDRA
jgi:hypothetical protein